MCSAAALAVMVLACMGVGCVRSWRPMRRTRYGPRRTPSRLLKSELQAWLRGRLSGNTEAGLTIMNVSGGDDDLRWDAFFAAMLESGPAYERRSRYGDKPALFIGGRRSPIWKHPA